MSQNKKIWFYTEGASEVQFVKQIFYKYLTCVTICKTESDFLEEKTNPVCFIHNSGDVNRIPFDINDMNHWIERSGVNAIVVICDIEKNYKCPIERKGKIIEQIAKDAQNKLHSIPVNRDKLRFVFSNPTIEDIYCAENQITGGILKTAYNQYSGKVHKDNFNLDILHDRNVKPLERLKRLFRSYDLIYKKRAFAESFFAQLDYKNSNSKTVKRLFFSVINVFESS